MSPTIHMVHSFLKVKSSLTTSMIIDDNDRRDLLINVVNEEIRERRERQTVEGRKDVLCLMMIVRVEKERGNYIKNE